MKNQKSDSTEIDIDKVITDCQPNELFTKGREEIRTGGKPLAILTAGYVIKTALDIYASVYKQPEYNTASIKHSIRSNRERRIGR